MGWKSTKDITKEEAVGLITKRLVSDLSNRELENMVISLGYGDDPNLEYYGYNFIITD